MVVLRAWVLAGLPVLLGGCSPLHALNALSASDDYSRQREIAYGQHPQAKLDVYAPTADSARTGAVVVFYHGGRWRNGSKDQYRFVAHALAAQGIVVVIPDYRKPPRVDWRRMLADAAEAYRWTIQHAREFGGDPRRVFLMGHSSGAHLAAMIAYQEELRAQSVPPCGFIGLAGPYDFLPIQDEDVKKVFESAEQPRLTQPITFVGVGDPPALLLTGDADTTVSPGNSSRMAAALAKAGARARVIRYPDVGHIDILVSLAPAFDHKASTVADSLRFMGETACRMMHSASG